MDQGKTQRIEKKEVYQAWKAVRANRGAAGVDGESIAEYESKLEANLYKLWNRMSSGSYMPKPVREVLIPKKNGGLRPLGIPTVEDRIAQQVVLQRLQPMVEPMFCEDSYAYRPDKDALQAVGRVRERCWKYDWVIDLDIAKFFDSISHELLMKAVSKHSPERWITMYIERWLKAGVRAEDGTLSERTKGTPQGGVISPLLANLFMHYAFDRWMQKQHPMNPFARYADDVVIHCRTYGEAERLLVSLEERLAQVKLTINRDKTRIVYCKNANRKQPYRHTSFDFLGYTFGPRMAKNRQTGKSFLCFGAAVSKAASRSMCAKLRALRLLSQPGLGLEHVAQLVNPMFRGWHRYYGAYCASKLAPVAQYFNRLLARWLLRTQKRFRRRWSKVLPWMARAIRASNPLFYHWGVWRYLGSRYAHV